MQNAEYRKAKNVALNLQDKITPLYASAALTSISVVTNELKDNENENSIKKLPNLIEQFKYNLSDIYHIDTSYLCDLIEDCEVNDNYTLVSLVRSDRNKYDLTREQENEINKKITSEILLDDNKKIITPESPQIFLYPVNENILEYFAKNPNELQKLSGNEFENVMAEIYYRLGYDVEQTKKTRDGGKDLILKRHEVFGDAIYYVECKRYNENNKVGVGIVRNLHSTVSTDRVEAGVIVTTSFFTKAAINLKKDLNCSLYLQNFDDVKGMLNKVTKK